MMKGSFLQRTGALLWLLIIVVLSVSAVRKGVHFDTSILALLPESQQQPLIRKATDHLADSYANKVLLVVSAPEKEQAQQAVTAVAKGLAPLKNIAELSWQAPQDQQTLTALFPYRFAVLSEATRARLQQAAGEDQLQLALQRLLNPLSGFALDPVRDPFSLYPDLLLSLQAGLPIKIENGLLRLTAAKEPSYLLTLDLKAAPFSMPVQKKVEAIITPLIEEQRQQGVTLRRSGLLFHAAAGANQAQQEMSTIGVGSLLGIVLMIMVVFRSLWPLALVLIPVLTGTLIAVAATLLLFGRLHLVTVAFGAGLVGVAVDYALHFVCESRIEPEHTVRKLFAGLLLGLVSSVAGYAGLALAPFPGLRQMALFCVLGLTGAWITVLLWLPLLRKHHTKAPLAAARWLDRWRNAYPHIGKTPWLLPLMLILGVMSAVVIWQGKAQDSVALLQSSPKALIDEDRQVQQWLGNGSSAAFLLVTGSDLEQVLQSEERLQPTLASLQQQGLLGGYAAVSQVLPSMQRQTDNAALVRSLYARHWRQLAGILHFSDDRIRQTDARMQQDTTTRLTPELWQTLPVSKAWSALIIHDDEGQVASVIRLKGPLTPKLKQALSQLEARQPEVHFVDRIGDISTLMSHYRGEITDWLLLAYAGVMFMLIVRYRIQFWRVVLPPLLASLITFAGFLLLEGGYNLFNLIALMLVLGIGLDMGIFLSESGDSDHTWLAVSLSALSSLLAFGLLALSQTPVLYHFGIIILPGLALTWLLAPLMRVRAGKNSGELSQGELQE
ncbi:MMPL family transporter [Pokkaliibacter sp. CJK22405]|uniref:MMPL family transporter n=1 Tax=Pokkaliibacter sp. CJK22405 TaxID=3384615 RepID=UPI0039847B94